MMKSDKKNKLPEISNPTTKGLDIDRKEAPPLIIRFGFLGDLILTTPLMRALAERHQQPCEVVAQGSFPTQVFNNLPFVQSVRTIDSNKTFCGLSFQKNSLAEWLKSRLKGPVYLLQTDAKSQKIIKKAGLCLADTDLSVEYKKNEHVIDRMARIGGFVDTSGNVIKDYIRGAELRVTDDEKQQINKHIKKLGFDISDVVVIQPGFRKWNRKQRKGRFWSNEKWIRLIQEILITSPDKRIIISGSDKEESMVCSMADTLNDHRVTELVLPLRQLFSLLSQAHSMISFDTGPAHAAAALDCPLVVLFREVDPRVICPVSLNAPVKVVSDQVDASVENAVSGWQKHNTMNGISVQNVLEAWDKL